MRDTGDRLASFTAARAMALQVEQQRASTSPGSDLL